MEPRAVIAATRGAGAALEARPDYFLPGRALQLLLVSSSADIAAAFSPLAAVSQSLSKRALDSLAYHSAKRSTALHDEILRPLLDQLVRHRVASERAPALRVCGALMREPDIRASIFESLVRFMTGEDRGLALGAVIFVEHELKAADEQRRRGKDSKNNDVMERVEKHALVEEMESNTPQDEETAKLLDARLKELMTQVPGLTHLASLLQPTRLACAAADALIDLSSLLTNAGSFHHFFALLPSLDVYLQAAEKWHATERPLLAAALPSVRRLLTLFKEHESRYSSLPPRLASALCSEWSVLAPLLILHPCASIRRQVRASLVDVASQASGPSLSEATFRALLSLCLALGRLPPAERDEALRPLVPVMLKASVSHMNGPIDGRGVALALLRSAAALVTNKDALTQPFFILLDEADGVSAATVAFLAEFAMSNLSEVLNPLFALLEQGHVTQRQNALSVIARIVSERPVADADLAEKLITALSTRLSDVELQVRCATSTLFASLPPSRSVPLLTRLLTNANEQLRSAALEALREVFCGRADLEAALGTLVTVLENEKDASVSDRAARAVAKSSETMTNDKRVALAVVFMQLSGANPASPLVVKLFAACAPALASSSQSRHTLITAITTRMQTQPALSEELLSQSGDESAKTVRALLFERLSPLLLLRSLPSLVYSAEVGSVVLLSAELRNRISQLYEYEEVRRMAAEIAGHICGSGEMLFAVLKESHAAAHAHITRAALFGLCTHFASPAATVIDDLCIPLISYLFPLLSRPPPTTPEEAKLRAGVTDCLAALARISLQRLPTSFSLSASPVQELSDVVAHKQQEAGATAVLPQLLRSLAEELRASSTNVPLPTRIASAAVLAALCRLASPEELVRLYSICLPLLCRIAHSDRVPTPISGLVLHALFTATFSLGPRASPYSRDLLYISLSLLSAQDAQLRLGALKLAGATLPQAEEALRADQLLIVRFRAALVSLATIDASADVKQLASKLLTLSGFSEASAQ